MAAMSAVVTDVDGIVAGLVGFQIVAEVPDSMAMLCPLEISWKPIIYTVFKICITSWKYDPKQPFAPAIVVLKRLRKKLKERSAESSNVMPARK